MTSKSRLVARARERYGKAFVRGSAQSLRGWEHGAATFQQVDFRAVNNTQWAVSCFSEWRSARNTSAGGKLLLHTPGLSDLVHYFGKRKSGSFSVPLPCPHHKPSHRLEKKPPLMSPFLSIHYIVLSGLDLPQVHIIYGSGLGLE